MAGFMKKARPSVAVATLIVVFMVANQSGLMYSAAVASELNVKALFLMDHEYGANYHHIRDILDSWGWDITVAGTNASLQPCGYQSDDEVIPTDVLIDDVQDVAQYDIVSIMPGQSYSLMLDSGKALSLIAGAVDASLVVSAWCKGIQILAAADVIDGKNVTGHWLYEDECEEAGAAFLRDVPPVTDGIIITTSRSRYYRMEMCVAMARALGVYEEDPPELHATSLNASWMNPSQAIEISASVTDSTRVSGVLARIYDVSNGTASALEVAAVELSLVEEDIYNGHILGLDEGSFLVHIEVQDIYGNTALYNSSAEFVVSWSPPFPSLNTALGIAGAAIALTFVTLVVVKRKR